MMLKESFLVRKYPSQSIRGTHTIRKHKHISMQSSTLIHTSTCATGMGPPFSAFKYMTFPTQNIFSNIYTIYLHTLFKDGGVVDKDYM
jgi:hypothetical protein